MRKFDAYFLSILYSSTSMKNTAKFSVTLWLFSFASFEPAFAAGDSNKPTQSPSSERPKKEDNSKPTAAATTEVQPSTAAKPVESKAAENKPSTEAKPEVKATSKPDFKSDKKPTSQSSKSNSGKNGKGNTKEGNIKADKTAGAEKGTKEVKSGSALPSSSPSQSDSSAKPSTSATTSATATPSSEPSAEHFVRIEKSEGNKATLIVSGQKIGSKIKITITSKGSKK